MFEMEEFISLKDLMRWGASRLQQSELCFGHGMLNALDESVYLCLFALGLPHDLSESEFDVRVSDDERAAITSLLEQRIKSHKPAAYLTKQAFFAGLEFYVDERVLVPRSPIAELVANRFSPWVVDNDVSNILDLCSGSACIAIACASVFEQARVDASDVSVQALEVAAINVKKHELEERVQLVESDLFASLQGRSYDIIVSNPPYVDSAEMAGLPAEYLCEPAFGLAAGEDGLNVVIPILQHARDYLNEGGILVVEVGNSWQTLQKRFPQVPFMWLEFERGGHGVFLLTTSQLDEYSEIFLAG